MIGHTGVLFCLQGLTSVDMRVEDNRIQERWCFLIKQQSSEGVSSGGAILPSSGSLGKLLQLTYILYICVYSIVIHIYIFPQVS